MGTRTRPASAPSTDRLPCTLTRPGRRPVLAHQSMSVSWSCAIHCVLAHQSMSVSCQPAKPCTHNAQFALTSCCSFGIQLSAQVARAAATDQPHARQGFITIAEASETRALTPPICLSGTTFLQKPLPKSKNSSDLCYLILIYIDTPFL